LGEWAVESGMKINSGKRKAIRLRKLELEINNFKRGEMK
jgi:hypothetical protein